LENLEKILSLGLAYILPTYVEDLGNVTRVATIKGNEIIEKRTIRSVLGRIASYYGIDIQAQREKYGKIIGRKNIVPIPLTVNLILVPFKVRKPIISWDGSLGYLSYNQIQQVKKGDNNRESIIILKCGKEIKCFNKMITSKRHITDAKIVYKAYTNLYEAKEKQDTILNEIQETYAKPATRADIAILAKEIIDLKEKLNV